MNAEVKHSPTPWTVEPHQGSHGERSCIVDERGSILVITPAPKVDWDEPNLKLMAQAPALLEALKAFAVQSVWADCRLPGDMRKDLESIYRTVVVPAIALAEGRS